MEGFEDEVARALEHVNVPSYLIDTTGVIRWVNEAGRRLVGDVAGRQLTSVVAHEKALRCQTHRCGRRSFHSSLA